MFSKKRVVCCHLIAAAFVLLLAGCGSDRGLSQADYEKAKGALEKALAAWKNGESAAKWTAKKAAIRFVDDSWIKGGALEKYEIVKIRANVDGFPEAVVKLTVKSKTGSSNESEALYGINLKDAKQIAIGRDPMY